MIKGQGNGNFAITFCNVEPLKIRGNYGLFYTSAADHLLGCAALAAPTPSTSSGVEILEEQFTKATVPV